MRQLIKFLSSLKGDVFKLLPMKEQELEGAENHLCDYIQSIIINLQGGAITYPILADQKQYLYVINGLQYLATHAVGFNQWRKIILTSTRSIDNLCRFYEEKN